MERPSVGREGGARRSRKRRHRGRSSASVTDAQASSAAVDEGAGSGASPVVLQDSNSSSDSDSNSSAQEDEPREAPKPAAQWGCPACTFLNESSRAFCEMCETPNPESAASPSRAPALGGAASDRPWSCVACTMKNPQALRSCAVCGTSNPHSSALSLIQRLQGHNGLSSDDDDDDLSDDDDDEDDDMEDENSTEKDASRASSSKNKKALKKARKEQERAKKKKKQKKAKQEEKNEYGVSSKTLKRLAETPTSQNLVDTLQTLTHTLAMMDASTGSGWGSMRGASLFIRSFDGSSPKKTKDSTLLVVLNDIFCEQEHQYPLHVRLLAVQSINYLVKLDRHLYSRSVMLKIVLLYLDHLLQWHKRHAADTNWKCAAKDEQMIVEECLTGLAHVCESDGFAVREMIAHRRFDGYLDFLSFLISQDGSFHPSIITTAVELLQKCCMKMRWNTTSTVVQEDTIELFQGSSTDSPIPNKMDGIMTVSLAKKLVNLLRAMLTHKHVPLHVKAAKCLLLLFHRIPAKRADVITELVSADVLGEFIALVANSGGDESEESRLSMLTLLIQLFDNRPRLVALLVKTRLYNDFFGGIQPILQSSTSSLGTHALKLTALLTRVVCRKHVRSSAQDIGSNAKPCADEGSSDVENDTEMQHRARFRSDSASDPDVLSTLLIDFVRGGSIPAVSAILKDGAELNGSRILEAQDEDTETPLQVAVKDASLAMVRFLVKCGADVHHVGRFGTALHVAALHGRCEIVSFLLQCGASVNAKNHDGKSVMECLDLSEDKNESKKYPSPVKRLLELHRKTSRQNDDSEISDCEDYPSVKARTYLFSDDHEDDFDDDEDEELDDEDEEDSYYMDYDEDEDEDDFDDEEDDDRSAKRHDDAESNTICEDIIKDNKTDVNDNDAINHEQSARKSRSKKRHWKMMSSHSGSGQANILSDLTREQGSEAHVTTPVVELSFSEQYVFTARSDEIIDFSLAVSRCLLGVLRDMDIQNVERTVISTLASVLEMAPSSLIHDLHDSDVVLILDTVHFLLQNQHSILDQDSTPVNLAALAGGDNLNQHKLNVSPFILSVRILQAIIRKSPPDSSIYYQIERRGICEQIEQLNDASASWAQSTTDPLDDVTPDGPRNTIFGIGLFLIEALRANMLESGTLHLHKLKNLARRMGELTEKSSSCERELALVDLLELLEQPNSITAYEFKQSDLLPALLQYVSPNGVLNEERMRGLLQAFDRCPAALKHLVSRLQSIITQEEKFPVVSFNSTKGRELYPLTRQLKISISRFSRDKFAITETAHGVKSAEDKRFSKTIQSSPLTHFQSFERTIVRCLPVEDSKLSLLYLNIVGRCIQKAVDGKWKKFWVCGYDSARSFHLLKPVGGQKHDMVEMVLHDSQYRLLEPVDVHQDLKVNLELFGTPLNNGISNSSSRKRKSNKKKRKLSHEKSSDSTNHLCAVEVQNDGTFDSGLPKAWYAGVIVDQENDGKKQRKFESLVKPHGIYTVRLLHSKKVIKNVPADRLRKRSNSPQLGSVVEVDGAMGQVTKVYSKLEAIGIAGGLLDVKINDSIEKVRVKLNRIQFPPSISTKETNSDQIEAMSIRRLFPARESSVSVGGVGDRVWVFPVSSSISDLCVAGTIKSFPSGLESIRESTTVNIEVSFGVDQPSLTVKVEQTRVLNFGCVGSGSGSSRLLAALKAATGHDKFGSSGMTLQQALQGVAGSMRSELGLSIGSSGMDQLRHLISRVSRENTEETNGLLARNSSTSEIASSGSPETTVSPDSERLAAMDADTYIASAEDGTLSSNSQALSRKKAAQVKEKEPVRNDQVWQHLSTEEATPYWVCDYAPKVNLLLGFYKREANGDRMSNKYAFLGEPSNASSRPSTDIPASVLLVRHPTTNNYELSPRSQQMFQEIFRSFDPLMSKPPPKKKRKTNSMTSSGRLGDAENTEWDLNKFCAFAKCVFQGLKGSSIAQDVDHLILFSKYASQESQRRVLLPHGFLALMTNVCKEDTKARFVLTYLKSLGHSERSLSAETENEAKPFSKRSADEVTQSEANEERNAVTLRGFSADRNVLSCVEELRGDPRVTSADLRRDEANEALPPWKFTYKVFCDFEIQWVQQSKTTSSAKGRSKKALKTESNQLQIRQENLFTSEDDSGDVFESSDQKLTLSFTNAVQLLRHLNSINPNSIADVDVWTNPRLYNKMESQLQDVLSMCSGIYPKWCDSMVTRCKFFFPRELREKLFRATSFGCTRSLHWFRNQLMNEEAQSNGDSGSSGMDIGGIHNQEISIAPIPKERVKVHRDNILSSAEAVMQMHAKRKAILDVVFVGEKGYGSGVTAAFYSATAYALQSCEENKKSNLCCWVTGEEDNDEVIRHPNGLFPFPHTAPHKSLVDRFRMMGRLAGKALMDERLLPLPLSSQFMKLIVGEPVPVDQIGSIFLSHGKIIHSMYVASRKLARRESNVSIDGMALEDWLNAVSFTFIDPMSQQPLHPGGEDEIVNVANMAVYVEAVLKLWLNEGVSAQVIAFREGISEVLPLEKLKLLFVSEILSMLCGDADIKWDAASLLRSMKLAHGYTKDSLPVQYLIETLDGMTINERRGFLLYATGCPNLPPGGFAALKPPFEVVRRVVDTEDVDRALPFARTCTNTLHLPAYSSKEVCSEKLVFAIANSQGVIDRD